jgi:pimeloyl-ACP methyl ester carboxylesterase
MSLALAGLVLLIVAGLVRLAIHLSLAPERTVGSGTPASVGLEYADVSIPTENRKLLSGWFIPGGGPPGGPAVVILHGWGGDSASLLPLARPLHEAAFSVLFIDARCHGKSDGDSFASMPRFAEDLEHAIDWLLRRGDIDHRAVAAIGHSVGAGAALLAASRRNDVAAIVCIAAFAHPGAMMRRWLAAKRIPFRPLGWLILRYVEWAIGHRFDGIAPINTIRNVRCPTLIVHGADDGIVPVSEARSIHAARSGSHVQLKIVAGSHDDFADLDKQLPDIVAFLSRGIRE